MEQIKLSQKELDTIHQLQTKQNEIIASIGQLEYSIQLLKLQKETLTKEIENLKKSENKIGTELTEKYGNGSIDLTSGFFTKTE